jgi:DNA-binding NarL/FixJ family response regulator
MLLEHLLNKGTRTDETSVLTDREREIVRLLAEGKSNRDIASHLRISVKTVETHRATVMHKLGFKSITDLVRYAIRNKLIEP